MATFHKLTTEVFTVASVLKGLPTPNGTRLRAGCFRLDGTPCPHERGASSTKYRGSNSAILRVMSVYRAHKHGMQLVRSIADQGHATNGP